MRSHVMRDLRRKQREEKFQRLGPNKPQAIPATANNACSNSIESMQASACQRLMELGKLSMPSQPGGSWDPFVVYPVKMQPRMYRLLHNCELLHSYSEPLFILQTTLKDSDAHFTDLDVVIRALHPKEVKSVSDAAESKWFALAMTDGALFHTVLTGSVMFLDLATSRKQPKVKNSTWGEAVHIVNGSTVALDLKGKRSDNPDVIYHMGEAIRLINEKLSSCKGNISDSTLMAVVFLAKAEVSRQVFSFIIFYD